MLQLSPQATTGFFFHGKNSDIGWCGRVELPWKAMLESTSGTCAFEVGSFQCVPGESCGRWRGLALELETGTNQFLVDARVEFSY